MSDRPFEVEAVSEHAESEFDLDLDQVDYEAHEQTWPSTSCGFEGMGGQAMTDAPTVVIRSENMTLVYHNDQFAYQIDEPNEDFEKHLEDKSLVGAR